MSVTARKRQVALAPGFRDAGEYCDQQPRGRECNVAT